MASDDEYAVGIDEIYTAIINTMLHLYALCWHEIEPWIHRDIFAAVNELRCGGWVHIGGNINDMGMSFADECELEMAKFCGPMWPQRGPKGK